MAELKLDSEKTAECVSLLKSHANGEILTTVTEAYHVMMEQGDNNFIEAFNAKFKNFENQYNTVVLPVISSIIRNLEGFEGMAAFLNAQTGDETIKTADVDPIQDMGFDVGASL